MCGIYFTLTNDPTLIQLNSKRGPDAYNVHQVQLAGKTLYFHGWVLGLRGALTPQPLVNNDNVLLYNGEIFDGLNHSDNDTTLFMNQVNTMVKGEYAYIYYEAASQRLYFGRDPLGRRSLLICKEPFFISSVATSDYPVSQVPVGRHWYDFRTNAFGFEPWSFKVELNKELNILGDPLEAFKDKLTLSLERRLLNLTNNRVAILFSGGLDCMVLAALSHFILPENMSIELLNVAFENPRINIQNYMVPDRITGQFGAQELIKLFPRPWKFKEINVPYSDYCQYKEHIMNLIYPNNTVMDLSIAAAFWFAAREPSARVLLSGLGADEQLGGYGRHKVAFNVGSHENLIKEIQVDVDRLPTRNLGRDDRVIADHAKEVRFPFLDEDLMLFLASLSINSKMDLSLEKGVGDKLLLRRLAYSLGLTRASKEPKRAVQFGARTAKMETSKIKGDQVLR